MNDLLQLFRELKRLRPSGGCTAYIRWDIKTEQVQISKSGKYGFLKEINDMEIE